MRKSQRTENLATNPKSLETSEHRGGNASLSDCQQGIHKLPVELLDFVMQSLWEDKRSILACSRVSRLWHEVAHPHLFAFLKIASQFDFVGFYAFLHANTDIAGHLRKLQLKHTITTWLNQSELPDGFPGVGRAQLRDLVASLPRLQDLHLYRLWVMSSLNPPPDVLDLLPTHSLEKLTIKNCDVPDGDLFPVTVLNIVSLFASVDPVKLVSLCLLILPPDRVRVIRPVNMGTLIITDISLLPQFEASGIYDPLRECLAPGCIRSLEIECLRSYHLDLWSRDRSGPTDRWAREPQGLRWQLRAAAGKCGP
ncbi:hypothetical protein TRAPUB_14193 [Trametes pubescens]|uniref:F-box domain-containing protein n=1 Tax=Trametes pubescens TaxID=154538 RepID=A0A1M2W7S0_TRAPU|nr:hypothetical protein TRAPUB_14193 [Trametes pubescens]